MPMDMGPDPMMQLGMNMGISPELMMTDPMAAMSAGMNMMMNDSSAMQMGLDFFGSPEMMMNEIMMGMNDMAMLTAGMPSGMPMDGFTISIWVGAFRSQTGRKTTGYG